MNNGLLMGSINIFPIPPSHRRSQAASDVPDNCLAPGMNMHMPDLHALFARTARGPSPVSE